MTASSTRTSRADPYATAVAELTSRGRFGISLGLERISAMLDELDHPERGLRGALIGGTNGKGSVVEMVRSVLQAAGLRVGTMPKPHLVAYRERIAVDGQALSEGSFAAAIERVLPAVDRVAARLGPPTEFEAPEPPRFAQAVGLVFAGLGLVGFTLGPHWLGLTATGAALAAAFLNSAFGYCLGCEMYLLLRRARS